jgi:hypothetical protein
MPGAEELVESPVGAPLPSVSAPPVCGWLPPLSTVLLAWMIAWRNGCTPNETLAMIAIPASTATGRSQLTLSRRGVPGRGSRSSRGRGRAASASIVVGQAPDNGQAQCPRQVQCLARSSTSAATLSSHGRGGRSPTLALIRSSASVPGSTWLTASVRARRSASSMRFSGAVTYSPASPRSATSWRLLRQDRLE